MLKNKNKNHLASCTHGQSSRLHRSVLAHFVAYSETLVIQRHIQQPRHFLENLQNLLFLLHYQMQRCQSTMRSMNIRNASWYKLVFKVLQQRNGDIRLVKQSVKRNGSKEQRWVNNNNLFWSSSGDFGNVREAIKMMWHQWCDYGISELIMAFVYSYRTCTMIKFRPGPW